MTPISQQAWKSEPGKRKKTVSFLEFKASSYTVIIFIQGNSSSLSFQLFERSVQLNLWRQTGKTDLGYSLHISTFLILKFIQKFYKSWRLSSFFTISFEGTLAFFKLFLVKNVLGKKWLRIVNALTSTNGNISNHTKSTESFFQWCK